MRDWLTGGGMQSRFVELEEQTDITQTVSHYGARRSEERRTLRGVQLANIPDSTPVR